MMLLYLLQSQTHTAIINYMHAGMGGRTGRGQVSDMLRAMIERISCANPSVTFGSGLATSPSPAPTVPSVFFAFIMHCTHVDFSHMSACSSGIDASARTLIHGHTRTQSTSHANTSEFLSLSLSMCVKDTRERDSNPGLIRALAAHTRCSAARLLCRHI